MNPRQLEGGRAALPAHVTLLGVPSVTLGERPLKFRYRKSEALSYLLLLERRRVSRGRVAHLCWPDADARTARKNLRVVLNHVRAKIGERIVAPRPTPPTSRCNGSDVISIALRDVLPDSHARARSRLDLASVLAMTGDLDAASAMLEEGADLARSA